MGSRPLEPNDARRPELVPGALADKCHRDASVTTAYSLIEPSLIDKSRQPACLRGSSNRRRHSFFGRMSSDAAQRERAPPMSIRPIASSLESPGTPSGLPLAHDPTRRRKTEPLGSIRHSLFGGRRKANPADELERRTMFPTAPQCAVSAAEDDEPRSSPTRHAHFRSQEEFYHHLRKSRISPPFNFQHITHTGKKHLPRLESVSEKELTAEFWAVSTQTPRTTLTGIKADDLADKHREMGIMKGSTSSRPTSPIPVNNKNPAHLNHHPEPASAPSLDEILGPGTSPRTKATRPMVVNTSTAPPTLSEVPFYPRRYSSMYALNQQWPVPPSSNKTQARRSAQFEPVNSHPSRPSAAGWSAGLATMREESSSLHSRELSGSSFRARQALPALPTRVSQKTSQTSFVSNSAAQPWAQHGAGRRGSTQSKHSSRSLPKSSGVTSTPDPRSPSSLSAGPWDAWEEDVDFCYQQEAESTCDFDWVRAMPVPDARSEHSVTGSFGLAEMVCQPAALTSDTSVNLAAGGHDASTALTAAQLHRRGSSVGHRGFLAARNASSEKLVKATTSPALEVTPELEALPLPSPNVNVEKEVSKASFAPDYLHFPGFEGNGTEYLSDADSVPSGSSKHRKSSSYGSYDSGRRSAHSGFEPTRWSSASVSSIPDLLHSQRKGKPHASKSRLGHPLEAVPPSPGTAEVTMTHGQSPQEPSAPSAPQSPVVSEHESEGIVMRRPQTPGDRAVLQSAGCAVQRGRPPTPRRFSRLLYGSHAESETPTTWL